MDPSPKLGAQVASIVGNVIKQCLLALAQPCEPSSSGGSSGAGPKAAGYLCRELKADLRYIVAFSSPRVRYGGHMQ